MVDREATPSHFGRPLSDEPWRFNCPDCESTSVDSLDKSRVGHGHDEFSFYCQGCQQKLEYVIDKQTDSKVYNVHEGDTSQ